VAGPDNSKANYGGFNDLQAYPKFILKIFKSREKIEYAKVAKILKSVEKLEAQGILKQAMQAHARNDLESAEKLTRQFLSNGFQNFAAFGILGQILVCSNRQREGIDMLRRSLALKEDNVIAWYHLGNALKDQKELSEALSAYQEVLTRQEKFIEARIYMASCLNGLSRHEEAVTQYQHALAIRSDIPEAHFNLGNALRDLGRNKEALESYRAALEIRQDFPEAHLHIGAIFKSEENYQAAGLSFQKAIELRDDFPEAHYNLANVLREGGKLEQAVDSYRKALTIRPSFALAYLNLGITLTELGRTQEAISAYQQALNIQPDYPEAHMNMGIIWQGIGAAEKAIESYRMATSQREDYAKAKFNMGLSLLAAGDYLEGFKLYEDRFLDKPELLHQPEIAEKIRRWEGETDIEGELLIVTEQGYGDLFQFMRYGKELANRNIKASIVAEAKLEEFLINSQLFNKVYTLPINPEQFSSQTCWTPLMSLPRHLGVTPSKILVQSPYLEVEDSRIEEWRSIFDVDSDFLIGLHWQGNPHHEKSNLVNRSFLLETFSPLAEIPGVRFVSLQKGAGSDQMATCSFRDRFVDAQEKVDSTWSFRDTAAMIRSCDLVITSDSAIVHLSGAIGHPTWVLLQKIPEWRWGLSGETTHWYESLRLFRQNEKNNWDALAETVRDELGKLLASKKLIKSI
jgi:tetratricopeptide (TPR) repeat protein